jgi:predicted nucleic acid-binding Zn ribbon protein
MPLRLYECSCENVFEELVDGPKVTATCPKCGKQALYMFGTASAHFKGTGFYETDYKVKR